MDLIRRRSYKDLTAENKFPQQTFEDTGEMMMSSLLNNAYHFQSTIERIENRISNRKIREPYEHAT